MNIVLITFSPTGGTLKCAELLASGIGTIGQHIDMCKRKDSSHVIQPHDKVLIAVPSYGGRVPALAAERLKHIKGNGATAVLLVVYGNRAYEDALCELEDIAKQCGFKVIAGVTAVARHSIVTKIATERPDRDDRNVLTIFGEEIRDKIENYDLSAPAIPGNRPYKKAGSAMVPKTNSRCNDCGRCASLCPSGAISKDNPRKIDSSGCIQCMRCISVCAYEAKYIPSYMLWIVGQVLKNPCKSRKAPELYI